VTRAKLRFDSATSLDETGRPVNRPPVASAQGSSGVEANGALLVLEPTSAITILAENALVCFHRANAGIRARFSALRERRITINASEAKPKEPVGKARRHSVQSASLDLGIPRINVCQQTPDTWCPVRPPDTPRADYGIRTHDPFLTTEVLCH
jgi:hypothetical protein